MGIWEKKQAPVDSEVVIDHDHGVCRIAAEDAKDIWVDMFKNILWSLTDYEMTEEKMCEQIAVSARLADAATEEIEKRWPGVK